MIETIITGDLGVNTYLFNFRESRAVIIDPGDDSDKIIDIVESRELKIEGIILTHGHFDHIGAVGNIKKQFNVPIYIHSADSTFLGQESRDRHIQMFEPMGQQGMFYVDSYYRPTPEPDIILEDGQELKEFGLRVIHTPGHSPGSVCLYSKETDTLFTGDTLFKSGLGRTDFGGGDYSTLLKSLEKIFILPGNTKVYPGHGPVTMLESEKGSMPLY